MIVKGYISGYDGKVLQIIAPFTDSGMLQRQGIVDCEIYLCDGRELTPDQRRKIFALVGDIADHVSGLDQHGRAAKELLCSLQLDYLIDITDQEDIRRKLVQDYCRLSHIDLFSLAQRTSETIDRSTARDFIDWLVELCVKNGIPCIDTLLNRCEDIGRYLYACVANRRCAICGRKADIHEVEHVGSGRDRQKIHHIGQLVQPLCRIHHNEVGEIGQQTFDRKYCLQVVRLDEYLCKKLNWKE